MSNMPLGQRHNLPDLPFDPQHLPPFMVDPPNHSAAEWAELMHAFRFKHIEPFLFPPAKKKVASPDTANRRARKQATRRKNATPTPKGPTKTEACKNVTAWISAARTRLAPFVDANAYAGLSNRLRKFYEELLGTAESLGKEAGKEGTYDWKYGYILVVGAPFRSVHVKTKVGQRRTAQSAAFGPRCRGQLMTC